MVVAAEQYHHLRDCPISPGQLSVHAQKLFFLLDERLRDALGRKYFDFRPYDYGPFDSEVYDSLASLRESGDVQIDRDYRGLRHYSLTESGLAKGRADLENMDPGLRSQISKYADWVRKQSFASLVSAIYREYPDMRVNSVFREEPA